MAQSAINSKRPNMISVLDLPSGEIERPPTLPIGYYHVIVEGQPRIDKSSQKQTEYVEYMLKFLGPIEKDGVPQVDEQALEEFGDVAGYKLPLTFYLTEKAKYMLKEFLETCGIEIDPKAGLRQYIGDAQGTELMAQVKHEPFQSREGARARVARVAPLETD